MVQIRLKDSSKKFSVALIFVSIFLLLLIPRVGKAITCTEWEESNKRALRPCLFNELRCNQKVTDECCDEANNVVTGEGYYCNKTKDNYAGDQDTCFLYCTRVCTSEEQNCLRETATVCKVNTTVMPSGIYLCGSSQYYNQIDCLNSCGLTRPIDCTEDQLYCEERVSTNGCWDWVFNEGISRDSDDNKKYYCVLNRNTYADDDYGGKARTRCRNECNEEKRKLPRCSEDERNCQQKLLTNCWDSSKGQMVPSRYFYCSPHGSWWSKQQDCQDVCEAYTGREFGPPPPSRPPGVPPGVPPGEDKGVLMPGEEKGNQCCRIRHNLKALKGDLSGPSEGMVAGPPSPYLEYAPCAFAIDYPSPNWAAYCTIDIIYTVTEWLFWILLAGAVIVFIVAGFIYLTAGGSTEKATTGRKMIIMGVVGLVVAVLAKLIPAVVRFFLGL